MSAPRSFLVWRDAAHDSDNSLLARAEKVNRPEGLLIFADVAYVVKLRMPRLLTAPHLLAGAQEGRIPCSQQCECRAGCWAGCARPGRFQRCGGVTGSS